MKHTMKKLLCMALAIMLLVSAVPVFAAADGGVTFKVLTRAAGATEDTLAGEKTFDLPWGDSVANVIDHIGDFADESKYETKIVQVKIGDGSWQVVTDFENTVVNNGDFVTVKLRNPAAPVDPTPVDPTPVEPKPNEPVSTYNPITFKVLLGDSDTPAFSKKAEPSGESASIANLLTYWYGASDVNPNWSKSYEFEHAYITDAGANKGTTVTDASTLVYRGQSVSVRLKAKNTPTNPTNPTNPSEPATGKITVTIKIGTTVKVDAKTYNAESATINELIRNWNSNWYDDYMLTSYKVGGTTVSAPKTSDVIYAGQTVTINLSKREKEALHDKLSNLKPVILHVYLNNNFNAEDAHYTITSIAEDGTLDLNNDVKNFLKGYYTAKTSDGITYDGMYVADGYFGVKYLADAKYVVLGNDADETGNTTLDRMRSEGYVHLNVMLTNAKAKSSSSSSTADSSNPKTGDTIFVPVMVMGVTATALAAAYVFGKKRFAR